MNTMQAAVKELHARGLAPKAIAKKLDVSTMTVYRHLKKARRCPNATGPAARNGNGHRSFSDTRKALERRILHHRTELDQAVAALEVVRSLK